MLMPAPIAVATPAMKAVVRVVRVERDREDRRERRERAVDQADHRRLDALQEEAGWSVMSRVYQTNRKPLEHKEHLTNDGQGGLTCG